MSLKGADASLETLGESFRGVDKLLRNIIIRVIIFKEIWRLVRLLICKRSWIFDCEKSSQIFVYFSNSSFV